VSKIRHDVTGLCGLVEQTSGKCIQQKEIDNSELKESERDSDA
jgi:hypothetical protein